MDLDYVFDNFEERAFRVETLDFFASDTRKPGYAVFQETGQLPTDDNLGWREEIANGVKSGKSYSRLRLFSVPLSAYERYEQAVFVLNAVAGEGIRAVARGDFPPARDFWVFDDRWIAYMNYDLHGEFVSAEVRDAIDAEKEMAKSWQRIFEEKGQDPSRFV